MRGLRIAVQIIAGFFLLCGTVPFLFFGHVNSGNSALVVFGMIALLLAIFWPRFCGGKWLRISRNLVAIFLLACFVCGFVISGVMVWFGYLHTPPKDAVGTVVVLGCEIHGDRPSLVLEARLKAALDYLDAHPDTPVVVAGGVGDDEIYSEAYVMRKYLMEHGIDAGRIYCEDASRDTEQNILFAGRIIEEQQLPSTMLIATDGFHEYRAFLHARENGHPAYALPVHDFNLATFSMQPEYWVREVLGILHFTFIA